MALPPLTHFVTSIHTHSSIQDDKEFERRFKTATSKMLAMCCEAAIRLGCHTLRVPAVGQGRYGKELPTARRQMLDSFFLDCFIKAVGGV